MDFGEQMRQKARTAAQAGEAGRKVPADMTGEELDSEIQRLEAKVRARKVEVVEVGREVEAEMDRPRSLFPRRKKRPGDYS